MQERYWGGCHPTRVTIFGVQRSLDADGSCAVRCVFSGIHHTGGKESSDVASRRCPSCQKHPGIQRHFGDSRPRIRFEVCSSWKRGAGCDLAGLRGHDMLGLDGGRNDINESRRVGLQSRRPGPQSTRLDHSARLDEGTRDVRSTVGRSHDGCSRRPCQELQGLLVSLWQSERGRRRIEVCRTADEGK